jgi:hypothetical protein
MLTTKFLKIQDKSQVNKNQEYIKIYLFLYLPNILYFLKYNLSGVRNKIYTFSLFIVYYRGRVLLLLVV